MSKIWELKQSTAEENTLELFIYGNVESGYTDWWTDEYIESETSANYFRDELAKHKEVQTIKVYINSFGGSVFEAMSIRNQLKRHSAKVIGIVDGFACSAASFILTGCDEVIMYSNTMQMIHNAWNYVAGNANELRKAASDLDKIMEGNKQAYIEKSNGKLSLDKLTELLDSESWLTANDCLQYGLCDVVKSDAVDMTEAQKLIEQRTKTLNQQINYQKGIAALLKQMTEQETKKIEVKEPEETIQIQKVKSFFVAMSQKARI